MQRVYKENERGKVSKRIVTVAISPRLQSICFKARQLLLNNLVLTMENREMHLYAV